MEYWPASPRLRTRKLDDLGPFLSFLIDELGELGGRSCICLITQVGDPRFHFGIGKTHVDLLVQQFDQFSGRVPWRANAMPSTRLVARQKFPNRWNVRQQLRAVDRRHCQRPQSASPDVLDRIDDRIENDLYLSANQIGQVLWRTAIWHMDDIDAGHHLEHLAVKV